MNPTDNISAVLELFRMDRLFAVTVGMALIIFGGKVFKNISDRLGETLPAYRLQLLQITTVLTFILYIVGTLALVFGVMKPSKELMLALGGSAAVAVGFSLKDLVGSIVAGVTLLFDRPFQVGDRVSYEDIYGEITNIGLRAVRLQTLDDNEVTIPNSKFMSDAVASGNSGALDMMIVNQFHFSLDSDIQKAKHLLYEVVATSRFVYLKKPIKIIVEEINLNYQLMLRLTVKSYVFDVRYEKDFQTDVYERGTLIINKNNIKRPSLENNHSAIV